LEFLVVLAAVVALFLAFLPLVNDARVAAAYAVVAKQEQVILAQTAADCREARLGGAGTVFSREWRLPAATTFYFEDGALKAVFESGDGEHSLSERTAFNVKLAETRLAAGGIAVSVENKGNAVEAVFEAVQESK